MDDIDYYEIAAVKWPLYLIDASYFFTNIVNTS